MGLFETIADRRIKEARDRGLFDNLPGRGKPIADLDEQRPPGWWAGRIVKAERDKAKHERLTERIRSSMPGLWRLQDDRAVLAEVEAINRDIGDYNRRTSFVAVAELDPEATLARWRSLR